MRGGSNRSVWFRLAVKALVLVLVGIAVGLFADALGEQDGPLQLATQRGWRTVVFWAAVLSVVYDFVAEARLQTKESSAKDKLVAKVVGEFEATFSPMLATIVRVQSAALAFPKAQIPLNVHLYIAGDHDGRVVLWKRRDLGTNFEPFPGGQTLDYADPDSDDLAICDAYKSNSVVFVNVKSDHTYNKRIDNRVDRGIGWVMGIPIHHVNHAPLGVICAFGTEPPFKNEAARRLFEQNMVDLAAFIAAGLALPDKFRALG